MTTMMTKRKRNIFELMQQRPCGLCQPSDMFASCKDCYGFVQRLSLSRRLTVHSGCVNSIWWNGTGTRLLSGSDDHHLKVTEPYTGQVLVDYKTEHKANIFSAKFLPFSNDAKIVSCSGDGAVLYTDLHDRVPPEEGGRPHLYQCAAGTTYEVITWDDPHCFLSGGEEGAVRCFDLRQHRPCLVRGCTETILLATERAVTSLALNPAALWQLAVATADGCVCQYDRRMIRPRQQGGVLNRWTAPGLQRGARRVTAMKYSRSGRQLLVSYSADDVYLFELAEQESAGQEPAAAAPSSAPPPVKRLRLRGDWSDTGPEARPERQSGSAGARGPSEAGQESEDGERRPRRPGVSMHASLINEMSDVLQRLLSSEMPARPGGATERPPPDLSRRPVTRRVMDRIRQRRALNMEQMVQGMEALHTSPGDAELPSTDAVRTVDDGVTSTCPPSDIGSLAAADDGVASACPASDIESPGDAARAPDNSVVSVDPASDMVSPFDAARAADDNVVSAGPTSDIGSPASTARIAHDIMAPVSEVSDIGSSAITSEADTASAGRPDTQPASHESPTIVCPLSQAAAPAPPSPAVDGAAIAPPPPSDVGGAMVAPPTGPYMDLERQAVVVSSEPMMNLYYNPQSSTAGQISIQSPLMPPTMASQGVTRTTFAERALLLSCDSAQQQDESDCEAGQEEAPLHYIASDRQPRVYMRFTGHRNARTMIKEANFWGDDFVLSGSDCGHVFIWDRHTGKLVTTLEADRHVVNCVQPHPLDPVLATSGIDYDIKLWAPLAEEPTFDSARANELMTRNKLMLEETRDTITVPASFMIRMLASLSSRRGRRAEDES